jgi:hypothetical protein
MSEQVFTREIDGIERRLDDLQEEIGGTEILKDNEQSWAQMVSAWYALGGRRALYVASSYDYTNPQWLDSGDGGYHLTNNNAAQFGSGTSRPLIPLVTLISGSSQYFDRADGGAGNWADITGTEATIKAAQRGLSMYAWVKFANAAGSQETVIGKWNSATNDKSYLVDRLASGNIRAAISTDGTTNNSAPAIAGPAANAWTFLGLQFDPSTVCRVIVDAENVDDTTSIPASIYDGASIFAIGAAGNATLFADMDIAIAVLCASYHGLATANALYHQGVPLFK